MPVNRSSFLLSFVHNASCGFNELFIRVCWEDRQTQNVEGC